MSGTDTQPIKGGSALNVLFVCTGNICRSPTAERLVAAYADRLQVPDLAASSAGTRAVIGHPIHDQAALVLQSLGGDAQNFTAQQLTPKVALSADLVLTMTKNHRDAVLECAPRMLNRTFTLAEAACLVTEFGAQTVMDLAALRPQLTARDVFDIADPIGSGADVFVTVGAQIADLLAPILELLRRSTKTSRA
ncbi:low molecular weight phosphatase family protein [Mycobacterium pyrenivorans]|nr:low molecular weight phosphatase family protein [Mycolicibacterium pyrenivorans]